MPKSKKRFTIDAPMAPLWLMYPDYPEACTGWRMGNGEGYKYTFNDWFDSLSKENQQHYQDLFPAPKTWSFYYSGEDESILDEEESYFINTVRLWEKHGEMIYNKSKLIEQFNYGQKIKYVFFWKPGEDDNSEACLGQWQPSIFNEGADEYTCAEQYMMAEKAVLFDDWEMQEKIIEAATPKAMKDFGQQVRNFDQKIWDKAKYAIVLNGNYLKFTQNEVMMKYLLSTGDRVLVEASPMDIIWGIGHKKDNDKASNPNLWRGQNLLGFALMEVRDEIRRVYKNYDLINWKDLAKL